MITAIQMEPEEDRFRLRITSDRPMEFAHFMLREPQRIIIDPVSTVFSQVHEFMKAEGDLVKSIRLIPAYAEVPKELGPDTKSVDFLIIALRRPCRYEAEEQGTTVVVTIQPLKP